MKTKYLFLFLIIIIAFALRFIWLDKVPSGISDDELDYVFTAKSIFLTGSDITRSWSPFSLTPPPRETPKAELPYLIMAPIIGALPFSLFTAKLTHVVFSLLFVFVLYLITKRLLGEKEALFVALVAAINPWSIFFGRTANDTLLAVFFYFLSLYLLLILKGWKILLAFPFLFIAFYTYIGTKIIFLPFLVIVLTYAFVINNRKYLKKYFILFLLGLLVFVYFIISSSNQKTGARYSEIFSPLSPSVTNQVDFERKLSIKNPLTNIFSNKLIVYGKDALGKYLNVYSPNNLFLFGEGRSTFSLWYHGLFYYLDIIFLIIGAYGLFMKKRKVCLLLVGIATISPLPSVISSVGTSYALRSSMLYPILIIFIGYGIYSFIFFWRNKKFRYIAMFLTSAAYIILLLNFLNIYFFRNPIYNSEGFGFSNRVLSRYINFSKDTSKIIITTDGGSILFKHYLFYTNRLNRKNSGEISSVFKRGIYAFDNIELTKCTEKPIDKNAVAIGTYLKNCKSTRTTSKYLTISQLSDGGAVYNIYNDKLCSKYNLGTYPQNVSFKDLSLEKLGEKEFCEKFISKHF